MEFTPRLQQILKILLREENSIPVKALAEQLEVSKRTVQRELEYIEHPLKKYGITFCSKTGSGIWLEGKKENKEQLLLELEREDSLDVSNRSERRKRLTFEILKDKTTQKLYYYSNLFGVSEATISSDLDAIEPWFQKFNLRIRKKQGYGISLEGRERDYRQAICTFLDENADTEMIREVYESRSQVLFHTILNKEKNIYSILDEKILKRVVSCILGLNDKRILNLTEGSYMGLIIHVTIAINRILKQEILKEEGGLCNLRNESEYELASYITAALEREFEISIPEIETAYICLHIKGSKRQNVEIDEKSRELIQEQKHLMEIVNRMIDAYDEENGWLLKQDEEFIRGLLAHLMPTMTRLSNGMRIKNPLLEQIKEDYPEIFKKCQAVVWVLEEETKTQVPEEETGFLAIHFGAAVVRMADEKENRRKVYIGLVCASGIGISRLMLTKIMKCFAGRTELTTYGKNDVTPYVLEQMDFFISTIPLTEAEESDVLYVSPLLGNEDMEKIEKKICYYERTPQREREENAFTRQLEQINYVAMQIKNLIRDITAIKVDNNIGFDELLLAVSEGLTPYHDRQSMIQEDIRHRESLGTQVFSELGFALLHTRTRGVLRPNFSLCFTKDKGVFANPYFNGIGAVVIMLLPEDEHIRENREILGYLSEQFIEEPDFMDIILRGELEEIREEVSRQLKRFFNLYLDKIKVEI